MFHVKHWSVWICYLELLGRWQRAVNLVGGSTLADPWRRHILDCAQVVPHVPRSAATVLDLGSGAGLPGLVLALMGVPGVHLVESDQRKAQFLREAARLTRAPVVVHATRIEDLRGIAADVVTARALAPSAAPARARCRSAGAGQPLPVPQRRERHARIDRGTAKLAYAKRDRAEPVRIEGRPLEARGSWPCV